MNTGAEEKHVYDDSKQKHRGHRTHHVDRGKIALRAYQIWQEHGCRHGHDVEDWFQSEEELHAARD